MGSEPFFIDQVTKALSTHVVDESARDFDSTIFYGKDALPAEIIETVKRFPMMGSHQLVVVREAQYLDSNIDELLPYLENPLQQTVLVLCYKPKKLDKKQAFGGSTGRVLLELLHIKLHMFESVRRVSL